jgi:hypothetical protein
MQGVILEFLKKYIGQTGLYAIVFLVAGGIGYAYAADKIVTPAMLEAQLDTVKASATLDRTLLEKSILQREKEELLDKIDEGKAKPRHKTRLKEVEKRLDVLDSTETKALKVLKREK